jgi:hypothetical protein
MAKFKPVRKKSRHATAPAGGWPCLILVIAGLLLMMFFFYFVMKHAR